MVEVIFIGFKSGYLAILKAKHGILEVCTKIKAHILSYNRDQNGPMGRNPLLGVRWELLRMEYEVTML